MHLPNMCYFVTVSTPTLYRTFPARDSTIRYHEWKHIYSTVHYMICVWRNHTVYTLYINTSRGSYVPICVGDVIHFFYSLVFCVTLYVFTKERCNRALYYNTLSRNASRFEKSHTRRTPRVRVLWGLNTYVSPVDVFVTVLYTKTVVMCCF